MHIRTLLLASCLLFAQQAYAADDMAGMDGMSPEEMKKEHGGETFHMFRLETDAGVNKGGATANWDLDGWIGTDENKLWLKSEGEHSDGHLETGEVWALYSHNIATFWDAQAGIRYDFQPHSAIYLTLGFTGLAPYYFETEAHLFVSNKGHVSARLREENDFLLTQKLILQPYAEVNLYLQDAPEDNAARGLGKGEIGLQTRYEFTRKFAPYIDIKYGRNFGESASFAERDGEDKADLTGSVGIRFMF